MKAVTKISHREEETEALAQQFAATLRGGEVLALRGGMGMGKTAFVRGLAQGLGVEEPVTSPTFALVNVYEGRLTLCHFDMYRITTFEELYSTGFFDYLSPHAVLAVEWSENIEEALPQETTFISLAPGEKENERRITFYPKGAAYK